MPFIDAKCRAHIGSDPIKSWQNTVTPGDKCYIHYREMLRLWKASPRWTTAHEIYKRILADMDPRADLEWRAARELAWQAFFQLHVMPYELKKRKENGEVEV